ncbi:ATP-binding cassette domain-containing protein [Chitinimonas lacunae]|uniref:ATP-binding cassette domain-containing protein n=1 Tax=Chitinimonas lacunae TaxID=1963018 RepID=A0ABV8MXE4_9NEIS
MLQCRNLTFHYQGRAVLDGINFDLPAGRWNLTGANGSGKSTLLKLLAGVLEPDAGQIELAGVNLSSDPEAAKRRIGYLPDQARAYPGMTPCELWRMVAELRGGDAQAAVAHALRYGLADFIDRPLDKLSFGTGRKCFLVAAWIGDPLVLLLDEPSDGLDAASVRQLKADLAALPEDRLALVANHDQSLAAVLQPLSWPVGVGA